MPCVTSWAIWRRPLCIWAKAVFDFPPDGFRPVAGLVESRPGQVSSMALASSAAVDFMLMSTAAGESVSEEEYFGDTLYHVVEGAADVALPERRVSVV